MAVTRLYDGDAYGRSGGEDNARVAFLVTGAPNPKDAVATLLGDAAYNNGEHPDNPDLNAVTIGTAQRVGSGTSAGFKISVGYAPPGSGVFSPPPPDYTDPNYDEFTSTHTTQELSVPIISTEDISLPVPEPYGGGPPPVNPPTVVAPVREDMQFRVGVHLLRRTVNIVDYGLAHEHLISLEIDKLHNPLGTGAVYVFTGATATKITLDTTHVEYEWRRIYGSPEITSLGGESGIVPVPARMDNEVYVVVKSILSISPTNLLITTHNPFTVGNYTNLPGIS